MTEVICRDFYSTEEFEANSLVSPLAASKTQVRHLEDFVLIGVIQQFDTPPEGFVPAFPDFTNQRLHMDVQHGKLVRGPAGLFDYGCIGLGAVGAKVMTTSSFCECLKSNFKT